ncbi:hypothetical protein MLD38_038850 [Melastoma candidum]|uniref:Uncharacterized protein n=1 Tax=Melastoma candidum TaxID=119954 RepID=A0ACB9L0Z7_9MYRT|nr:hypothetical protein MLD38_038850 [Melastoma candidum]
MAPKSFLITGLAFIVLVMAASPAEAQLGFLGGIIQGLLNLIHIQGVVPCSQTISTALNGTLPPVFPNAQVQLMCGSGNILASTTTDASGIFSLVVNPLQFLLSDILGNCKLVVPTPLSNCNPAFANIGGTLQSTLQLVGSILSGFLNIINVIPAGFNILPI